MAKFTLSLRDNVLRPDKIGRATAKGRVAATEFSRGFQPTEQGGETPRRVATVVTKNS